MVDRSKLIVVSFAAGIVAVATVSMVLRDRLRCAGFPGPGVSAEELPSEPPAAGNLRIAGWNLRNFPLDERPQTDDLSFSRRTNICDLETVLGGLGAHILALQEVCDARRFPPILRRAGGGRPMRVVFSAGGGKFGQHLAIAWDDTALELVGEPGEIAAVALDQGMRPALAAYFRSRRPGGADFTVVVVHLQATKQGFSDRRRQNRALESWVNAWVDRVGDPDVILLGDFNTTGSPRGGLEGELASVDAILGRAGLRRLVNAAGCSQYWEGNGPRDGIQQPSLLDHVYLGGFTADDVAEPVRAWLHCARFECEEMVSRPGEEDGTFWDVSDHCPLTFEIRDTDSRSELGIRN